MALEHPFKMTRKQMVVDQNEQLPFRVERRQPSRPRYEYKRLSTAGRAGDQQYVFDAPLRYRGLFAVEHKPKLFALSFLDVAASLARPPNEAHLRL
jgi:hypothetical protein